MGSPERPDHFEGLLGTPSTAAGDSLPALQKDSDLSRPQVVAAADRTDQAHQPGGDILQTLGTEAHFLRHEPLQMRAQFHLPANASSEQLFEKIASAAFQEYEHSRPELKADELKVLGLTADNISPQSIFAAQMAQRAKEFGVTDPNNYAEIELKMNKKFYADYKAGKVAIDYD